MSEHADQFDEEPGDDTPEEAEEAEEVEEADSDRLPWAKTSSGDADEI